MKSLLQVNEPLLTTDEEIALARRVAQGDMVARDRMVLANLGLAGVIARRYAGKGLERDELIHEGVLGLIRATEKFDPDRGIPFASYADWWIEAFLQVALATTTLRVRFPKYLMDRRRQWERTREALARETGQAVDDQAIARRLGFRKIVTRNTAAAMAAPFAIHQEGTDRDSGLSWLIEVRDYRACPLSPSEAQDNRQQVLALLARLKPRESRIIELRYGLGGGTPQTQTQVAEQLGMTGAAVSNIEGGVFRKLRKQAGGIVA